MSKEIRRTLLLDGAILTTPKPKGRPRFTAQGRAYTPAATIKAENEMANALRRATNLRGGTWPKEGQLSIEVTFGMPIPPSWSKKKQQQARAGEIWHTSRPDVDNLLKLLLDAANGILWVDDAQLVAVGVGKAYALEEPGVTLKLFSLSLIDEVTAGDDA